MKKIGIIIKKFDSSFVNGCMQQMYFLVQQLRLTGYHTELVSFDSKYKEFEIGNEDVKTIHPSMDLSEYNLLIFGSVINHEESVLKKFRDQGIKLVNLICGNYFILHHEEYVFNVHDILERVNNDVYKKYVNENWVLPMYQWSKDYIELMTGVKTIITPYVWGPDFIDDYLHKNDLKFTIKQDIKFKTKKLSIAIFEPNLSIHKTSMIPLLMCDRFYKKYPDRVEQVYHFCTHMHKSTEKFFQSLKIVQDNKIQFLHRIIMPNVMHQIAKSNAIPVVLTNNFMNELNFLHLELMYLGIPIIHNCSFFKSIGFYYKTETLLKVDNILLDICNNITENNYYDEYLLKCNKVIERYLPQNKEYIREYKRTIENIIGIKKEIILCIPLKKYLWFYEIAKPLCETLRDLGFNTSIRVDPVEDIQNSYNDETLYILYCVEEFDITPKKYIVYQFEHLLPKIDCDTEQIDRFISHLRGASQIWDMCYINKLYYDKYNITNVVTVPLGFHSCIEYKDYEIGENLDDKIVCIGNFDDLRRQKIVDSLDNVKPYLKIYSNNVWVNEDARVGQLTNSKSTILYNTKILLNIKLYDPEISSLETPRIINALANNCLVITEKGGDEKINKMFEGHVIFVVTIEDIERECLYYLNHKDERDMIIMKNRQWLQNITYKQFLPIKDIIKLTT